MEERGVVQDAHMMQAHECGVLGAAGGAVQDARVMPEDVIVMRGGRWALRHYEGGVVKGVDGGPEGEGAMVEAYDAMPKGAVVMGGGRAGFGDHEGGMGEDVRVMPSWSREIRVRQ